MKETSDNESAAGSTVISEAADRVLEKGELKTEPPINQPDNGPRAVHTAAPTLDDQPSDDNHLKTSSSVHDPPGSRQAHQLDITRYDPPPGKSFKAPNTFNLPEMVSYCLSSDLSTLLYCSANAEAVLGCPINQVRSNGGILLRHVHFDDRFRVLNALEDTLLLKQPVLISYRWNTPDSDTPTVFVNHCVAAASDYGEVISGVIFRINPGLSEELSVLGGSSGSISRTRRDLGVISETSLNEHLEPLGATLPTDSTQTKNGRAQSIPFLDQRQERQTLEALLKDLTSHNDSSKTKTGAPLSLKKTKDATTRSSLLERQHQTASKHLFHEGRVYFGEMSRVERDTFSPHYNFILRDVTDEFLKDQELKSLRSLKRSMVSSGTALSELEKKIEKLKHVIGTETKGTSHKEASSQLSAQLEDLVAECRTVRSLFIEGASSPFLSGRELLLRTAAPIAAEVPSDIQMSIVLSDRELYLWKTVGDELIECLNGLSRRLSGLAHSAQKIEIKLSSAEHHSVQFKLTFSFPLSLQSQVETVANTLKKELAPHKQHLLSQQIFRETKGFHSLLRVELLSPGALRSPQKGVSNLK